MAIVTKTTTPTVIQGQVTAEIREVVTETGTGAITGAGIIKTEGAEKEEAGLPEWMIVSE